MQNFCSWYYRKIFRAPPGNLSLKTKTISKVDYKTIHRNCNYENRVSSRKLAVIKKAYSGKASLAKTFV